MSLATLWANKPVRAVVIAAAFAAVVYMACFLVRPVKLAETTLYFPISSTAPSSLGLLGGGAPADPGSITGLNGALSYPLTGAGVKNAQGILLSYSSLQSVLTKLQLQEKWHSQKNEDAYRKLESKLKVSIDKDSGFLKVTFEDEDPALAEQAVGAALEYLKSTSNSLTVNPSRHNRIFIEQRLDEAAKIVDQTQKKVVLLGSKDPTDSVDLMQKSYWEGEQKLVGARVELASANKRIAALTNSLNKLYASSGQAEAGMEAATSAQSADELATISKELATRRILLEDAMSMYQEGSAELAKAKKDIQSVLSVSHKLGEERQKAVQGRYDPAVIKANAEAQALAAAVQGYQRAQDNLLRHLSNSPGEAVAQMRAKSDFEAALTAYQVLVKELAVAKIAEDRDPSRFEMVDPPHIDPDYVFPKKSIFALIGFVIALILQAIPSLRAMVNVE